MSVASEYDHAEQVVTDVALLQDMAAGRLDTDQVQQAAKVLLPTGGMTCRACRSR